MKWSIGKKISGGFGLALAILCVIGVTSYRAITLLLEASELESNSNEILVVIELTLSHARAAETSARGFVLTGSEKYLAPYQEAVEKLSANIDTLRLLTAEDPAQQRRLDELKQLTDAKNDFLEKLLNERKAKSLEAAVALVQTDQGQGLMEKMEELLREMRSGEKNLLSSRRASADIAADRTLLTIIFGVIFGVIFLGLAGIIITRNITLPMGQVVSISGLIAAGDLTGKISYQTRSDEIGMLAESFRTMTENLREQTKKIVETVNFLSSSTSEISASVSQLASSTAETSTSVSETSATAEEIKQTAQVAAQKAKYVSDTSRQAEQIAKDGRKAVEVTVESMDSIKAQMESIGASIMKLSEQGQAIGEIIAVVDDIADQTNLLAVNAAIEAAKADEHGKGFAVVAQEIRSLAEQSKQATTRVRTILNDVRKATSEAVLATEQGNKKVDAGVNQSQKAGESIQALTNSVAEAAQAGMQITASSQQQMAGTDQVAAAMENIKQATSQNAASTKQLDSTVRKLAELGHDLKELVDHYKID